MRNDKTHELRSRASRSLVGECRVGDKRDVHYSTDVRLAEHVKLGTGGEGGATIRRGRVAFYARRVLFAGARAPEPSCLQTARHNANHDQATYKVVQKGTWRIFTF